MKYKITNVCKRRIRRAVNSEIAYLKDKKKPLARMS